MKIETLETAQQAVLAIKHYAQILRGKVSKIVSTNGKFDSAKGYEQQRLLHGLAWIETYSEALAQLFNWASTLNSHDKLQDIDKEVLFIGFGEYIEQIVSGIPMSQTEFIRPSELDSIEEIKKLEANPAINYFLRNGNTASRRQTIIQLLLEGKQVTESFDDDTYDFIRDQLRRFTEKEIKPCAHNWHQNDTLIPIEVIEVLSELGVFGISIPEEYGGTGLGKLATCIVTEELSRGYLGAGSLGTRSEIASELISNGGTTDQKERWLPAIASGTILPTAVFTEPEIGSDLSHIQTRAHRLNDGRYKINGNKTWITHAARSDLMTILARTDPDEPGHAGLSMFIAEKPRGTDIDPFPINGLFGSEIGTLGYRGMKEYELSFQDFEIDEVGLLGKKEGRGFKQLMTTFESARIQTAARAIGVAWNSFDVALNYAIDRQQFGRSIVKFPRIHDKLAMMLCETIIGRELTYYAARKKDDGLRCDVEAGMAKLLAARVAWSNADCALQIHGGNGYALEYEISRILCDARILNIFEGAAEIQAHVIGRRLVTSESY